jgi:hypothetical protein
LASSGVPPAIQCQVEEDEGEQAERAGRRDSITATLIEGLYGSPETESVSGLLYSAHKLQGHFVDPPGPRTRLASAASTLS